jgi:AdoMet-dependent rRNA methyltransferase SPB1
VSALEFVRSPHPIDVLAAATVLTLARPVDAAADSDDARLAAEIAAHPATTSELKACLDDIKMLGRTELKSLLIWRDKIAAHLRDVSAVDAGEGEEVSESEQELSEGALEEKELADAEARARRRLRKEATRARDRRMKTLRRLAMSESGGMDVDANDPELEGLFRASLLAADGPKPDFIIDGDDTVEMAMLEELRAQEAAAAAAGVSLDESAAQKLAVMERALAAGLSDYDAALEAELDRQYGDYKERVKGRDSRLSREARELERAALMKDIGQDDGLALDPRPLYEQYGIVPDLSSDPLSAAPPSAQMWFSDSAFGLGRSAEKPAAAPTTASAAGITDDEAWGSSAEDQYVTPFETTDKFKRKLKRKALADRQSVKEAKRAAREAEEAFAIAPMARALADDTAAAGDSAMDAAEDPEDSQDTGISAETRKALAAGMGILQGSRKPKNIQAARDRLDSAFGTEDSESDVAAAIEESDGISSESDAPEAVLAERMAIAGRMLHKSEREAIIDASYNRFVHDDRGTELPEWFTEDERRHSKPQMPITKEEIESARARLQAVNARPIKKVMEAKARKKVRALRRQQTLQAKADALSKREDLSEREKVAQLERLAARLARRAEKSTKTRVEVAHAFKSQGAVRGHKKRSVDRRMIADGPGHAFAGGRGKKAMRLSTGGIGAAVRAFKNSSGTKRKTGHKKRH